MMVETWWLDLWLTLIFGMTGFGLLFAIIGVMMVAAQGRSGWPRELTVVVFGFPLVGLLAPLIVLLPFVALYRAVKDK